MPRALEPVSPHQQSLAFGDLLVYPDDFRRAPPACGGQGVWPFAVLPDRTQASIIDPLGQEVNVAPEVAGRPGSLILQAFRRAGGATSACGIRPPSWT